MPKEIELQNGMKAIVDDEDYERVNQYNWVIAKSQLTGRITGYAEGKNIALSHFILRLNNCDKVVMKNNNYLDYRKENLLKVNSQGTSRSTRGHRNSSSKYKGVSWNKSKQKWVVFIKVQGKNCYLGSRESEDDAAILYNEAARKYFGEHAYQNVIGRDNTAQDFQIPKSFSIRRASEKYRKKSKYRGVTPNNSGWQAKVKGKYIGNYKTEIEAAKAYNERAKELFGDKAILNDIH